MALTTTTTAALNSASASAPLAITSAAVQAGTAALPVYALAPVAGQAGVYLAMSPDFIGSWRLTVRGVGMRAVAPTDPTTSASILTHGDQILIMMAGAGPIAEVLSADQLTLALTAYAAGSITMAVQQ